MSAHDELAIVLTGGGARASYQVGVLRAIARRHPDLRAPILIGTSAGGINAAFLANHTGNFAQKVENLWSLWKKLDLASVFETQWLRLFGRATRLTMPLFVGSARREPPVNGMVDTRPLRKFLTEGFADPSGALPGIAENLLTGRLRAVALTALRYSTGQTVTFFSGNDIQAWERPNRVSVHTNLDVEHVMASAALPFFFPAVSLGGSFYGDGGIRLVAPLAPALHLGATRVLALSTRYSRSREEADRPAFSGPPSLAQIAGVLYNAIFHDALDQDALQLERINRLLGRLPPEEHYDLQPISLRLERPSRDLGALAAQFEPRLPAAFRFLTRRLGTRRSRTQDFLSTVMFQPEYIGTLLEIGEADGEARAAEIAAFLGGTR
jgi:NTE family protein